MSAITTHVLDTSLGKPAPGVPLKLDRQDAKGQWVRLGLSQTDEDGRAAGLLLEKEVSPGRYRLTFETGIYFKSAGTAAFYPYVEIVFEATATMKHLHVPLLLSPFGYTTYRGS